MRQIAAAAAVPHRMRLAVALVVLATLVRVAAAHPLDVGYLRITPAGDTVEVSLDLNIDAASNLIGVPRLDASTAPGKAAALAAATFARAPIATPDGACAWKGATASIEGQSLRVRDTATCPTDGRRTWTFPFVRDTKLSSSFELLVKETVDGDERVRLVDRYEADYVLGTQTHGVVELVLLGIEHIGVAPNQWRDDRGVHLPDGIDHILFLLALLLAGGKPLRLLGIATGFTVGHSITLALATFDVVRPPASVIEPLVALTIAVAAAEAFTGKWEQHRWKIASAFGLVHGFAFATAIGKLGLGSGGTAKALFGFNLGVELGQVVLVLVFAPLVTLAHRNDVARRYVIRTIAALIFLAGIYWFFVRLGL